MDAARVRQNIQFFKTKTKKDHNMSNLNGKGTALVTTASGTLSDIQSDLVPSPAKKKRESLNKVQEVRLDLDAGSSQAKFVIDGWCSSFPSIAKEVTGELPSGILGCFSIGSKNYAVGKVTNSLNGKVIEGFKDNKIRFLHIWLIGALCNHPDLLSDIADTRKYKNKPARLKISLRLLSLSSSKKDDIAKILQGIKEFTCEGVVYQVEVDTSGKYLLPESYGAALQALHIIPEGATEFHLLDLGGGTLTFSGYQVGRRPRAGEQTAGSGCGMKAIIERLSIALARVDRGGLQYQKEGLEVALRNSKPDGKDGHTVKYRYGQETLEIGATVTHALSEWVSNSPIVENLLSKVAQALLNGIPVFATGGGMSVSVIADWVKNYVCNGIENPQFYILDNSESINLTGLKHLDA